MRIAVQSTRSLKYQKLQNPGRDAHPCQSIRFADSPCEGDTLCVRRAGFCLAQSALSSQSNPKKRNFAYFANLARGIFEGVKIFRTGFSFRCAIILHSGQGKPTS